ncbi:lachesin isoform X2 [Linepithema humile]|uniref:lachesin isoform X2 n=1 Tax=Linepithema humile TaxID=83485 RepID=UPI00351E438E
MMRAAGLTVICALLQIVAGQRTPTISYISQEQIKDIGESVELRCIVQYASDYPILWIKIDKSSNDQVTLSYNQGVALRDSRFSLKHEQASSSYILQIKDIQETDAGLYQCKIQLSLTNHINAQVEILVRKQPIISDNSTQSQVVSEGQSILLECYATGYPAPRISWRRENNAILPTGGSIARGHKLKISSIQKDDRGTYYCVAENGVGRGARRNINVEVEFKPVISAARPRLGQALQYDMDLECHVEAYPPPAIIWLKDGIQLSNNQHHTISHFATADEYTDSTLRVITIEKRQYGEYKCRAANKLGTDETTIELFEISTPNINYPGLQWAAASQCDFLIWLYIIISIVVVVTL